MGNPHNSGKARQRIVGVFRYIALALTSNLIPLASVIFLGVLLLTDQGQELLKIEREITPGIIERFHRIGLPLLLYEILVTLTSIVVAQASMHRLIDLAARYELREDIIKSSSGVFFPLAVGYAPTVLMGLAIHRAWWIVPVSAALGGVGILPWLRRDVSLRTGTQLSITTFRPKTIMVFAIILASSVAAVVAVQPDEARTVGSIGVVIVALAFWTALLSLLFVALPLWLGLPGLAVLAPVPWLLASCFHDPDQFPRRATVDPPRLITTFRTTSIDDQFIRWMLSRDADRGPIPVYLISAEGGGLRAAYWTARVLTELNAKTGTRFAQHAFAYSGVSGGSLGVATFLGVIRKSPAEGINIVDEFLGRDYLAPLVGHLLLTEPLWQLFGSYSLVVPRDTAFEQQWESDWRSIQNAAYFSRPFLEAFAAGIGRPGPVVIFNATNSETGKRVLFANVDDSVVSNDYLFPLSTAGVEEQLADVTIGEVVHLSARFPFVSPPASIQMLVPTALGQKPVLRLWGHVVDGGYFDNSGGLALRDVYEALTELRDFAQRGDRYVGDQDLDWERARLLIARVRFHIVVIRNDPLTSDQRERSDYPTLSENRVANLSGDAITAAWNGGDFSRFTPTRDIAGELTAPITTVLSTRDARASATRRVLWEAVAQRSNDQMYQCELARRVAAHQPVVFPLKYSPECVNALDNDIYTEISLGEIIADDAEEIPTASEVCSLEDARGVALGWVLAERSERAMSCLVLENSTITEIAGELNPVHQSGIVSHAHD